MEESFDKLLHLVNQLSQDQEETRAIVQDLEIHIKDIQEELKYRPTSFDNDWSDDRVFADRVMDKFNERGMNFTWRALGYSRQSDDPAKNFSFGINFGNEDEILVFVKSQEICSEMIDWHIEEITKLALCDSDSTNRKRKKIYGGVICQDISDEAQEYAVSHGLFIVTFTNLDILILNDEKFKPQAW